jgi:hypothetical protein
MDRASSVSTDIGGGCSQPSGCRLVRRSCVHSEPVDEVPFRLHLIATVGQTRLQARNTSFKAVAIGLEALTSKDL